MFEKLTDTVSSILYSILESYNSLLKNVVNDGEHIPAFKNFKNSWQTEVFEEFSSSNRYYNILSFESYYLDIALTSYSIAL
jgi:hypothetical protein